MKPCHPRRPIGRSELPPQFFQLLLLCCFCWAAAELAPGDVFRDYSWCEAPNPASVMSRAIAVAGPGQYAYNAPAGFRDLTYDVDLTDAIKAEVIVYYQHVMYHLDNRGHAIQVNDNPWIAYPIITVPSGNAHDWGFAISPTMPLPLTQLKAGTGNKFQFKVDKVGDPFSIVYGAVFRVYYDPAKKKHPTGKILSPSSSGKLGELAELTVEASSPNGPITKVEYLGNQEDVNFEGDGKYKQYHCTYFHGVLANNVGMSKGPAPFKVNWNTAWVPDQPEAFKLMARITDSTGLTFMTDEVPGLTLLRPGKSVELCKPYNVPTWWSTDEGHAGSEKFDVKGNLKQAVAAQFIFLGWNAFNNNGFKVNGTVATGSKIGGVPLSLTFVRQAFTPVTLLKSGANTFGTAGRSDGGVHGCDINWPGVQVLVQYKDPNVASVRSAGSDVGRASLTSRIIGQTLTVPVPDSRPFRVTLTSADGRKVISRTGSGLAQCELSTAGLAAGTCLLVLETGLGVTSATLMLPRQ